MTDLDTRTQATADNDAGDPEALGRAQLAHAGRVVAQILKIGVGLAIIAAMVMNFTPASLEGFFFGYVFGALFGFGLLIDGLLGTHFFKPVAQRAYLERSEATEMAIGQATGAGRYGFMKNDK